MADSGLRFIHKDGRIIPIRQAASGIAKGSVSKLAKLHKQTRFAHGVVVGAGAVSAAQHGSFKLKSPEITINKKADLIGLGLSVASGAIAAATFSGGAKGLLGGFIASHAIDAGGIAANVASVSGKGHAKERAEQGAKQEARNFLVGNAVFAAGLVASNKNRATVMAGAKKGLEYSSKLLSAARKALRVGLAVE